MAELIVYLVHFDDQTLPRGSHYLGIAPASARLDPPPPIVWGRGGRPCPPGRVVDVWEVDGGEVAARVLKRRLQSAGAHSRICSVCRPGNGWPGGRGKYDRAAKGLTRSPEAQRARDERIKRADARRRAKARKERKRMKLLEAAAREVSYE